MTQPPTINPTAQAVTLPDVAEGEEVLLVEWLVQPGQAVVLHRGTWHDAAYGVDGPTPYYWVAFCPNTGVDEWADVVGEAVVVRPEEGP